MKHKDSEKRTHDLYKSFSCRIIAKIVLEINVIFTKKAETNKTGKKQRSKTENFKNSNFSTETKLTEKIRLPHSIPAKLK